ncbi:MAG: hypothetical protein HPY59_14410 [Anaerolineae bacterium]|nr:hypothetical protein [Anaerolineae bacterium]
MKLFIGILLFTAVLFSLAPGKGFPAQTEPSLAATPAAVTDDQVNAIARELYCPVCENVPLDVCPTQACAQWRDLIRQKLIAGWNEGQIKEYFALQYGDRVLAEPPRRGLNWLVYILPPVIFLAGFLILFQTLRRLKNAPQTDSPASPPTETIDPYLSRLEEELRRREKE